MTTDPSNNRLLQSTSRDDQLWRAEEVVRRSERGSGEPLGERLARLRKERGLTQVELAEMLGTVQPVVSDYERGLLRLNAEVIIQLSKIFGVSADELLGIESAKQQRPVKNRRLLRKVQELESLPRRDQEAVIRTINAFLSRAS